MDRFNKLEFKNNGGIKMNKKINIEGMNCGHCIKKVRDALNEVCGVKSVDVDLKEKIAVVELAHEVDNEQFKLAIDNIGYKVTGIETL